MTSIKLALTYIGVILLLSRCNYFASKTPVSNVNPKITKESLEISMQSAAKLGINQEFAKSIGIYKKIISDGTILLGENDPLVLRALLNVGAFFAKDSELDSAILYLNRVEMQQPNPPIQWIESHSNMRLGFVYFQLEEYEIALNYLKKSQETALLHPKSEKNFAESAFYQINCLEFLKKDTSALVVIDTTFMYLKSKKTWDKPDSNMYGELLTKKADILKNQKKYSESIENYEKSMLFQKDPSNLVETLIDKAQVQLLSVKTAKAKTTIKTIEADYPEGLDPKNNLIGTITRFYQTKGDVEKATKNYTAALENYNLSLNALQYSSDKVQNNTGSFKTRDNTDSDLFLDIQNAKADIYKTLYANSRMVQYADTANAVYNTLSFNAKRIRLRYLTENAKIALSTKLKPIYQSAMNFNLALFEKIKDSSYLRRAFDFCEQTKAMSVFESVQINNLNLNAATAALKAERDKARIRRTDFEKQLANDKLNDAESKILNDKCLALRDTEKLLTTSINNAISDDIEKNKFSISDIQHKILDKNQALVEYALSDSLLTTFVISPEKISYRQFAINSNFLKEVNAQIATFNDENKWNAPEFAKRANSLYNILFKPVENILPERLIVISEPQFDLLPLETLLTDTAISFEKGISKSVLYKHSLSFAYSAQLLGMQWAIPTRPTKKTVAFAPSFPKDPIKFNVQTTSPSLQNASKYLVYINNSKEIDSIKHGTVLMRGPAATKNNFIAAFNGDAIVHASTHGILNNARSNMNFIAFSQTDSLNKNELLFVDDLYAQPLPTPLLVLTACETSAGNITSEGNISIARGLAYSGVKSYVTTLLPARASFNADLFKNFYENILDKRQNKDEVSNKDEALNKAKIDFIERFGYYNPAYWSGFILVGDDRPIDFKPKEKTNYVLIGLSIVALLSLLGLFFYRLKSFKK